MANSRLNNSDQDSAKLIRSLARHQHAWAAQRQIEVDDAGNALSVDENLFSPLSQVTRAELSSSHPSALCDGEKTGELSALCSTAALVHNMFDFWRGRPAAPIERACGSQESPGPLELRFAATGSAQPSPGQPPPEPADVVLTTETKPTVIAASFLEPYTRVDNQPTPELLDVSTAWHGLQACRNLALDLRCNSQRFRHLAVARLVEIGQSWTCDLGERGFRLLYLWYDGGGPAADRIRAEIDRFRMRVGGELAFEARSWQEFFRDLRSPLGEASAPGTPPHDDAHEHYLQYLSSRYFPVSPSP